MVDDMATGQVPNDKEAILNPQPPARRTNSAKVRAASQTPERQQEIAARPPLHAGVRNHQIQGVDERRRFANRCGAYGETAVAP
jgi:hypothetical protein